MFLWERCITHMLSDVHSCQRLIQLKIIFATFFILSCLVPCYFSRILSCQVSSYFCDMFSCLVQCYLHCILHYLIVCNLSCTHSLVVLNAFLAQLLHSSFAHFVVLFCMYSCLVPATNLVYFLA